MLSLDHRDGRPIYEQVRDGLRRLIITGAIPAGDKLPSVRAMAAQLAINPNTIQRAYEALEQEGYAYSVPGKGSFAALPQDVTKKRREELMTQLDAIVQELLYLGMSTAALAAHCAGFDKESAEEDGSIEITDGFDVSMETLERLSAQVAAQFPDWYAGLEKKEKKDKEDEA